MIKFEGELEVFFMKKLLCTVLSTVLAMSSAAALNMSAYADSANTQQVSYNYWYNSSTGYTDENVHTRQMEKLDRGLIAIKQTAVYI